MTSNQIRSFLKPQVEHPSENGESADASRGEQKKRIKSMDIIWLCDHNLLAVSYTVVESVI